MMKSRTLNIWQTRNIQRCLYEPFQPLCRELIEHVRLNQTPFDLSPGFENPTLHRLWLMFHISSILAMAEL